MKTTLLLLVVAIPVTVRADVVLEWNEVTLQVIRRNNTTPPMAARTLAMVHGAIYDAVNSVDRTHQPLRVYVPDMPGASTAAAAAEAAFRVLLNLYPNERANMEATIAASLSAISDGPAKSDGIRLGDMVATRMIAWRSNDNSSAGYTYRPGTRIGDWQPTPPGFKPALLPQWPYVAPFGIPSAASFRPGLPPALNTSEYARDVREVQTLGSAQSLTRTAEQTDIALFWADGVGTVTPPGHWNRIAQAVAYSANTSTSDNARLFALLNVALMDASIVCWDAKFTCNLWRPVTAIQRADVDGNDQTEKDENWLPLLETPPFPTCSSGHSTFSGAAAQVLALFFKKDEIRFVDSSEGSSNRREFASFSQAAEEAGRSRIYGGIHFEFDNQAGLTSGRAVGRYIFDNLFQRLRKPPTTDLARRDTYRMTPSNEPVAAANGPVVTTLRPAVETPIIWHSAGYNGIATDPTSVVPSGAVNGGFAVPVQVYYEGSLLPGCVIIPPPQ